jgi:hypothetical protein
MLEREIYNKGRLLVTQVSGEVKSQELIDHVFWSIDSHNIGEIQSGYDQVVHARNIKSVNIKEEDVLRLTEISTGLGQIRGKFRTVIIAAEPTELKLASFYQSLVKGSDIEVEICSNFEEAFAWLGCENPEPERYQ